MATNKRLGEDVVRDPSFMHRLAWLRRDRSSVAPLATHSLEQKLRERTA